MKGLPLLAWTVVSLNREGGRERGREGGREGERAYQC